MITLVVFTDSRDDLLDRTIASAAERLHGPITSRLIYDDTGDPEHRFRLAERYPTFGVHGGDTRRGFGGAIRAMWDLIAHACPDRYIFHLEDDFTFNRDVNLAAMLSVLEEHPCLVQLALRRQPWNDEERAAGGIVEQHPEDYIASSDRYGNEWLEHRRFFTTNPSLYRRSLCDRGWPAVEHSEGAFTHQLLADHDVRFGYWGPRHSGEWVTHIGKDRAGAGY